MQGKVAFVFPGQGAQKVGMGRAVFSESPLARAVFEEGDRALGESLSCLCFEGPEEHLKLTANTQPALLATAFATYQAFAETPDVVAGHSLGEYTANVVAGTVAFVDAIKLVRLRGTYMQEAVPVGEGAMAAVLKVERDVLENVLRQIEGVVEAVNFNCPGQIVIAGHAAAVAAASEALKAKGGRVMPLPVSAPFHSSLMQPAEERLKVELERANFRSPKFGVVTNVDAQEKSSAEGCRQALVAQVSRAVRWDESVTRMRDEGVALFVEIGPGSTLTGLIKRTVDVPVVSVETPEHFAKAREMIRAARA